MLLEAESQAIRPSDPFEKSSLLWCGAEPLLQSFMLLKQREAESLLLEAESLLLEAESLLLEAESRSAPAWPSHPPVL